MPVTVPPLAHRSERAAAPVLWLLAAGLAFLLAAVLLLGAAHLLDGHNEPRLHEYNGTTWEGDACFVDADGVLWCQGGSI